MPRAVPAPLRQRLVELHRQGQPTPAIAAALGLPRRTVRRLVRRLAPPAAPLLPDYRRCGRPPSDSAPALDCRRQHPGWGAPYIRVVLAEQGQHDLPSPRTLQRHLRRAGLQPAPPGRRGQARHDRAAAPHLVWQLDASERVRLRSGQQVCWPLWQFATQDPIVDSSPVMVNGTLYVTGSNFGITPEVYVFGLPGEE